MTSLDLRVGALSLLGNPGTSRTLRLIFTADGDPVTPGPVSVWIGGDERHPNDFTGAVEHPAAVVGNEATVTVPIPAGQELLRLTIDSALATIGTVAPSLRGTFDQDQTVQVNLGAVEVHVTGLVPGTDVDPVEVVTDPAAQAALSATFVGVVDTIEGAQVFGPVRQPTIVADRRYPTIRTPWRILWADGHTWYALGRDRTVYKTTNAGSSWTKMGTPTSGTLGTNGVFLKLSSGTLLSYVGGTSNTIVRSVDDGVNWSTVETLRAGRSLLGPQSICEDPNTGHVYYVEYSTSALDSDTQIMVSTDDGATWSAFHTFDGPATSDPDRVRHLHACQWDPVSERVYFTAGDGEAAAGIYRVNADGDGVEAVFTNRDDPNGAATAIGLMFFDDFIAWGGDSAAPHNRIYRMGRSELSKPEGSRTAEAVFRMSSTGWFTCPVADDGSAWIVTTSNEGVGSYAVDAAVHVYLVEEQGARVHELAAVAHDGGGSGWPSIAPVGSPTVQGDTFWLQSFKWGQPWQMRCQIARGWQRIDPAEKPPLVPAWITHNSGTVTVPAGGSVVFGYAVVSDDMNVLKTWDMGAVKLGGNGTVRVEQYNATAGSAITNTTAASYRRSLNMEDAEFVRTQGGLTNGTMIHFRLIETTGTDDVTAIGFVTFGWAAE